MCSEQPTKFVNHGISQSRNAKHPHLICCNMHKAHFQQGGLVPLLKNWGDGNVYNKDQLLVLLSWPMDPSQDDNSWHDKSEQLW